MKNLILAITVPLLLVSCAAKEVVKEKSYDGETLGNKKALAVASLIRGNYREAIKEIGEAEKINSSDPEIYNIKGIIYFSLKEYDQAEGYYNEAITLKPDFSEARYNLCGLYLTVDKPDQAIEQCSKAASDVLYGARDKALTSLGTAYFKKGDIEKAKEYYQKSLEINPAFVYTRNELGKLYLSTGKVSDAIEEFRKAVDGYDLYDEAHYNLALAYLKLARIEDACKSFKRVVEISPETSLGVNAKSYLSSICANKIKVSEEN